MEIKSQYDFFKNVSLTDDGALNVSLSGGGGGDTPKLFAYNATDYSDLLTKTGMISADLAYVFASQGTQWLPGTIGGNYYPQGIYVYDGSSWTSDRNNIALQLELDNDRLDAIEDSALKVDFFQVRDNNSGALIPTVYSDIPSSVWDTPIAGSGFTWNGTEITVNEDSDIIEFSTSIQGKTTGSNRVELGVRLMQDTGSGYTVLTTVTTYAMRNVAVDEAGVVMPSFIVSNVTANTKFKIQIIRVGGTGINNFGVQGGTYLNAKIYNNV